MATTIDTKSLQFASAVDTCHLMPCKIHLDGEANASDFFHSSISQDGKENGDSITGTFRGRPLNGKVLNVPSGYTGVLVTEPHKRPTEEEDRLLVASHKYDKFTYWNLDKEPTSDDLVQKALQWVDLSSVLHNPISPEESQDSQESMKGQ
ncbi:ribonuclease H2 subunit C-like [Elysia marginata]|uniref:Ribonuclease H2 subunit C-like n=1 Tax=Elysia marginata TaxID=1093978 RepID=A0AAV4IQ83_9GAST|nr:ribonuclease H2 subunit C-like [Elysia marginata]